MKSSFLNHVFTVISKEFEKKYYSYEDAILHINKNKRTNAMRLEMKFMYSKHVKQNLVIGN